MEKKETPIDIHAYVDGQLDEQQNSAMLLRLAEDADLRQEVAELQMLKEMVKSAYAEALPKVASAQYDVTRQKTQYLRNMAASFVLLLAVSVGWLAHSLWYAPTSAVVLPIGVAKGDGNYLLQMSAGSDRYWQQSIAEIERLLLQSPTANVELLVNDEAIAMLAKDSLAAEALLQLTQATNRLKLSACRQGLDRWRERGAAINLIPDVDTSRTALEEVVRRIDEGWRLIAVSQLKSA